MRFWIIYIFCLCVLFTQCKTRHHTLTDKEYIQRINECERQLRAKEITEKDYFELVFGLYDLNYRVSEKNKWDSISNEAAKQTNKYFNK